MRIRRPFGFPVVAAMAMGAIALVGCGGDDDDAASGDQDLREVSVILDWVMEATYAPLLYGVEHGIFADHGIDLDIIPGQGSDLAMGQINENELQFAFTDLETYLIQRADDETPTTAVYAWLNEPTIGIVSTEPIEQPEDIVGMSWGTVGFSSGSVVLPFVLAQNDVDPSSVTIEVLDFGVLYSSLFEGAIDSAEAHIPGSWEGVLIEAREQGRDIFFIPLSEWGLESYSKMLVVRDDTIDEDPDLVSDVVAAMHESLTTAMAEATEEEIVTLLQDFDPQAEEEQATLTWENFLAIVHDPGPLDAGIVEATLERLQETQSLDISGLDPGSLFDNSYIPT